METKTPAATSVLDWKNSFLWRVCGSEQQLEALVDLEFVCANSVNNKSLPRVCGCTQRAYTTLLLAIRTGMQCGAVQRSLVEFARRELSNSMLYCHLPVCELPYIWRHRRKRGGSASSETVRAIRAILQGQGASVKNKESKSSDVSSLP